VFAMSVSSVLHKELEKVLKSGVTRYQVAKDSGVAITTLSNFLYPPKGEKAVDLRLSTVDALADYLGLEVQPAAKGKKRG
jgi:hypothetical protein